MNALIASEATAPTPAPCQNPGARALVVVSDEILGQQITDILRLEAFVVEEARGGLEVLKRLGDRRSGRVQLLVLDISCDPLVGRSLLHTVFCEDWTLPVILVCDGGYGVGTEPWRTAVCAVWMRPLDAAAMRRTVAVLRDPSMADACFHSDA